MHQFMIYIHQLIKCDDDLYQALIKCREVSSLLTTVFKLLHQSIPHSTYCIYSAFISRLL